MHDPIKLDAIISKIATSVDGGWHVTLALGNDQIDAISALALIRDMQLQIVVVPYAD